MKVSIEISCGGGDPYVEPRDGGVEVGKRWRF